MSRIKKEFQMFGIKYRTVQMSAMRGLELLEEVGMNNPIAMLELTEVYVGKSWRRLDDKESIDKFVKDKIDHLPPVHVLKGLVNLISEFNFGFLVNWKGAKVPSRFASTQKTISSEAIQPLAAQLLQDGNATLKDLEEYYSLEDAFKMFDVIVVKGVNEAYANEDAKNKEKQRN